MHVVVDGVINGESVQTRFGDYLKNLGEDGSLEPSTLIPGQPPAEPVHVVAALRAQQ